LGDKVIVTGQPAFDKYAQEDTEKIYQETRRRLGLKPEECLISFFSISGDQRKLISQVAKKIKILKDNAYFALRPHPRSVIKKEEYDLLLKDSGIRILETSDFSSDQINVASDIIMTTTSTEGLIGIYRQKPTIHILDKQYGGQNEALAPDYVPPPCLCGASELVLDIGQLAEKIEPLMDRESLARKNLIKNIRENFLTDGKNTERVTTEIENILENKK